MKILQAVIRHVLILLLVFAVMPVYGQNISFEVEVDNVIGENTEFWKAAGSDHLFYHVPRPSGQALLNRMKSTNSHRYFRSHHTFNQDIRHGVIRGQNVYAEDANGNPIYDFSNVNRVFGEYVKRGMKPIVEYDYLPDLLDIKQQKVAAGNDEGMIMRNTGPNDWQKWSDLMKAATRNLIDQFGEEEVRTWYFEVWNEPDGWPVEELDVFFRMYDVFVDAVTSIDPKLKVGGPACYHEYFLRPFLQHVVHGTNYVTGEKGTRIDFISYHIYGLSGSWLNKEPDIHPRVQRFSQSVLWLQRLISQFPELSDVEFHLNEWGMSSNYYRLVRDYPDLEYRNSEESALFLVKLVNSLYQIEDNYDFPTSLLLYWGFCGEADEDQFFVGKRELTTAGNVPKPIQTGFEMLARLKEERLTVTSKQKDSRFGVLATKSKNGELALLVYNYDETDDDTNGKDEVFIELAGLQPNSGFSIVQTDLNRASNNTYRTWEKHGKPTTSKGEETLKIQAAGNLSPDKNFAAKTEDDGKMEIRLSLYRHSMSLLEIKMD